MSLVLAGNRGRDLFVSSKAEATLPLKIIERGVGLAFDVLADNLCIVALHEGVIVSWQTQVVSQFRVYVFL